MLALNRRNICASLLVVSILQIAAYLPFQVPHLSLVRPAEASDVAASGIPAGETTGITDKDILIGSCSALEGPVARLGTALTAGAKVYLDYINDQGGVHGRHIKLVCHDDSYNEAKAIECFSCLLKDQVFCGAFFVGAPPATKYVPMAEANQFPIVGFFTGVDFLHQPFRPHVISVRNGYADEASMQVGHLWKDLGIRKIGVIYQGDACGTTTLSGAKKALAKLGSNIVGQGSFAAGSLDVQHAIDMVRASNAEAVIMDGANTSIVEVVKKSHAQGWHPLFVCVSFVAAEPYLKQAGADAEGTVITEVVPSYERTDLPTVALYRKLLAKYSPDTQPTFVNFEGFVDALVLVEALKRAGRDLTRTKLLSALESMHDLDIGLGPEFKLKYGPTRHKGFDGLAAIVIRDGKVVPFSNWKELQR